MVGILLIIMNKREEQILKLAFEQSGCTVKESSWGYNNYAKMLQYMPDAIVMEIPEKNIDQLNFANLIRSNKKTKKIPIFGYGNAVDEPTRRGYVQAGILRYYDRPLKFSQLRSGLEVILKQANKSFIPPRAISDKEKDIELVLAADTLPRKKIEIMASHVSKILAFPFTVAKTLHITQDVRSGAGDLAKAIEADPVISAHLLRVSNSVFFASTNRRINTIKEAIVRIGFNETRRIVMTMSVMQLMAKDNRNLGFDRVDFWYHSLAVGIIASRIAKNLGDLNTEEAFLAGLLHDFGIIILDEFFPTIFAQALDKTVGQGGHFIDVETKFLGINHNDVVLELFPQWKIPVNITQAISTQYQFAIPATINDDQGARMALCVGLGNLVAKALYLGRECDQYVRPVSTEVFQALHLLTGITPRFIEGINDDIRSYRQFLDLEQREFPGECNGLVDAEKKKIGFINTTRDLYAPPALYLAKEGFTVEAVPADPAKIKEFDNKLDLVVVWGRGADAVEAVKPYTHLVRFHDAGEQRVVEADFAPVIYFCDDPKPVAIEGPAAMVAVMPNLFDLRSLDQRITELTTRPGPVAVEAAEKTEKESVGSA